MRNTNVMDMEIEEIEEIEFEETIVRTEEDLKRVEQLKKWSGEYSFYKDILKLYSKGSVKEQKEFINSREGFDIYCNIYDCHVEGIVPMDKDTSDAMKVFVNYVFEPFEDLEPIKEVDDEEFYIQLG